MCFVTIKDEHFSEYATNMMLHSMQPFIPGTMGMVAKEVVLSDTLTVCFVDWLPLGMYPTGPAVAINKKYLQELN